MAALSGFAVAMAFVEAAVVVYLRALLGGGALFPMQELPPRLLAIEVGREAATIAMLASVAALSIRGGLRRAGAFLLVFALWDIFYYVWLYVMIGWPSGPAEWDILFLIPLPWVGPVWSVLLISAGMIAFAAAFLRAPEQAPFAPGVRGWALGICGAIVVVVTYVFEWKKIGYGARVPDKFSLLPFFVGVALLFASGYTTLRNAFPRGG